MSWLTDPYRAQFMRDAALVAALVGVVAPSVGVWVIMRRLTYLGDAMSHGTLGGVALAFLVGVGVVWGALAAGLAIALLIGLLSRRATIATDSAIGVASTALFALGVLLISRTGGFGVELSHFLFGQIVAVSPEEVRLTLILSAIVVTTLVVMHRDLQLATFDPLHARQVGVRLAVVQAVVLVLVTLTIVVSLRTVGLLMSIALLVVPANAARQLASTTAQMMGLAVTFGLISALGGLTMSYHLSSSPGATIALVAIGLLVVSLVASRRRARVSGRVTA